MFTLECDLIGDTPLGFGKPFSSPRQPNESAEDHEERCWRERTHTDEDGNAFVPATAIKKMVEGMAKYLSEKIPGKGNATYSKHFRAGIVIQDNAVVINPKTGEPWKSAETPMERLYVPSDGKCGGSNRVFRNFPYVPEWELHIKIYVYDPVIKEELITRYLKQAGIFGGIGRFRPSSDSGGHYGRFQVANVKTQAIKEAA